MTQHTTYCWEWAHNHAKTLFGLGHRWCDTGTGGQQLRHNCSMLEKKIARAVATNTAALNSWQQALRCARQLLALGPSSQGTAPELPELPHISRELAALITDMEHHAKQEQTANGIGRAKRWRVWCKKPLEGGAAKAHRHTRVATPWTPTTTLALDGETNADPLALLKAEGERFTGRWRSTGQQTAAPFIEQDAPFELLTPGQLRAASKQFKQRGRAPR